VSNATQDIMSNTDAISDRNELDLGDIGKQSRE
jgi:hypothetical protein